MKIISSFIGKFPFIGKILFAILLNNVYFGPTWSHRRQMRRCLIAVLALFIVGHGGLAFIALYALRIEERSLWADAVLFMYALINGLVSVAQIDLLRRVIRMRPNLRPSRYGQKGISHTVNYALLCLIVTTTGQALFGIALFA